MSNYTTPKPSIPTPTPTSTQTYIPPQTPTPPHNKKFIIVISLGIFFLIAILFLAFNYNNNAADVELPSLFPTNLTKDNSKKSSPFSNFFTSNTSDSRESDEGSISELPFIDTNQTHCFSNTQVIDCPSDGKEWAGQDAQYSGAQPSYQDNNDGTVTDLNTKLMWQQDPGDKKTYAVSVTDADSFSLAGYDDWRLPTIKELYSLIQFSGMDVSSLGEGDTLGIKPFIDTDYFAFEYGDTSKGSRIIDSQWATSNVYNSTVMNNQECFFGVNFADGRIKCYPTVSRKNLGYFTIYVRGEAYGDNLYQDNGNQTITDSSTGLVWQKADSGKSMNWSSSLNYCEGLSLAGQTDWRLPNVKELQYIVDYTRSPDFTNSAAIDPVFTTSVIMNENGQQDYPYYWSSTTHLGYPNKYDAASYVSFGRALGYWQGEWQDVHGAGAQRSDPKTGDPKSYPEGRGPQGDAIRIFNYARCVRGGVVASDGESPSTLKSTGSSNSLSNPSGNKPPTQNNGSNAGGQGGTPPQEAIDICSGESVGSSCSFSTPRGVEKGSCREVGGSLACVPG